ncbi:MAG: lamin tail domain-containing protein [Candidatus Nomurabacteria bacterium]|nr:MAG: lamin tail domain-containing protein [Candidatus Nomurabacteria bacterium]
MRVARFCLLFIMLPLVTEGAVSISEVAWMGSSESANHEWIELHNDGEAIDVTGWVINDGMNLNIELTGVIPAGSYVVLERTSDASAKGEAFLIYTGALVNTGATLRMERSDGTLVDQVAGGENWINIGGDNLTKETAQYTTSGWKTAIATPGSGLVWNGEEERESKEVTESRQSAVKQVSKSSSDSKETVKLVIPDVTLQLHIDAQKVGYVHQPISFNVKPSGIGKHLIDSLEYKWNFGDGLTGSQKDTQHVFDYPGTYVVTVHGLYKRQEQVSRHEITILPVKVSLTTNVEGDIQINNDSPYELDLSGYRLKGEAEFIFPSYTIVLPNQTVTIPKKKLGKTKSRLVALYDTENALLSSSVPEVLNDVISDNDFQASEFYTHINSNLLYEEEFSAERFSDNFSFSTKEEETETRDPEISESTLELPSLSQTANVTEAFGDTKPHWSNLALVGVLSLGILGIYATPRRNEKK